MSTGLITFIAMVAFAANSLLCRFALAQFAIDPGSFTVLRILSGMFTLLFIHVVNRKPESRNIENRELGIKPHSGQEDTLFSSGKESVKAILSGGLALFIYAIGFSYAYVELAAGTGALLLFGAVQLTMIAFHLYQGNSLNRYESSGLLIAILGFVFLMLPSASAPDMKSALMMVLAGISWAVLTLLGKRKVGASPRVSMTQSFLGAAFLTLILTPWMLNIEQISLQGALWALLSGVFASGIGYVIWYLALTNLSVLQASVAQLSVPIIALVAGAILLGELLSITVMVTSVMILGGIALIFWGKKAD
ncbi:DMT family transporter [Vibrio genomosp. F10]|uniref:DMT family transporter n=1 Tax=Vibrio genomosp. F10 TaxID=723171 RepID=UPI00031E5238|nr:DMT family transporter [Vibrio genomosp. F10]OEF07481.1 multidrug transporter [Vibrio genomosp. F10 str. 9ZB36]